MLEMDLKGNLYLHKNALLCKYEIIKRLTSGKYHLEEESPIGNLFTLLRETIKNLEHRSAVKFLKFNDKTVLFL